MFYLDPKINLRYSYDRVYGCKCRGFAAFYSGNQKKIPEYISSYLTWYQVQTQKIEILHYIISYLSQLRFQKKFRPNESLGEALKEDLVKRTSLE